MAAPEGLSLLIDGEVVRVQGRQQCLVESKTTEDTWYSVEIDEHGKASCTCRGYEIRKKCRHARAVERWMNDEADVRFRQDAP